MSESEWYWCLVHKAVEHGPGCPNRQRLGPYATEFEAAHAIEHAAERNEEWREQDKEWDAGA